MVVVGGLVGAGALGYDVVPGFTQSSVFGKGLAAGLAIVLLGVMLDRITRGAAELCRHGLGRRIAREAPRSGGALAVPHERDVRRPSQTHRSSMADLEGNTAWDVGAQGS